MSGGRGNSEVGKGVGRGGTLQILPLYEVYDTRASYRPIYEFGHIKIGYRLHDNDMAGNDLGFSSYHFGSKLTLSK